MLQHVLTKSAGAALVHSILQLAAACQLQRCSRMLPCLQKQFIVASHL